MVSILFPGRNLVGPPLPNRVPPGEEDGVQMVIFAGVTGSSAPAVNGVFERAGELANGKSVFLKVGDVTLCLWYDPDKSWLVGPVSKKDMNHAAGSSFSTERGLALPTDASGWNVYDGAGTWCPQPTATCVAATEEQAAAARATAGTAGLALATGWAIQGATGPGAAWVNGLFKPVAGEVANGRPVCVKVGDGRVRFWYCPRSRWVLSVRLDAGPNPPPQLRWGGKGEACTHEERTARLQTPDVTDAGETRGRRWRTPAHAVDESRSPRAATGNGANKSKVQLRSPAPPPAKVGWEPWSASVEFGLASPTAAVAGFDVWDGGKYVACPTLTFTPLSTIWRLARLRAGGFLRLPLPDTPPTTLTADHGILWPGTKAALSTVFLIEATLIVRPSERLPRIPPEIWLMILERVPVAELGRKR